MRPRRAIWPSACLASVMSWMMPRRRPRLAGGVARHLGFLVHDARRAVRPDDAEVEAERRAVLDRPARGRLDARAVVRVHGPDEPLRRGCELLRFMPEDAKGFVGPGQASGGEVPVPVAEMGDALGVGELHRACAQRLFGAHPFGDVLAGGNEVGDAALLVLERRDGFFLVVQIAVFAPVDEGFVEHLAGVNGFPQRAVEALAVLARLDDIRFFPDRLGEGIARGLLVARVDVLDHALGVGDEHRVGGLLDGARELVCLGLGVPALDLGHATRGANLQDRLHGPGIAHRFAVHHHQQTQRPAGGIEQRVADITINAHLPEHVVVRELLLDVVRVLARGLADDVVARRAPELVGKVVHQPALGADGDGLHGIVPAGDHLTDEGEVHVQRLGEIEHQRAEEFLTGDGGDRVRHVLERVLGAQPFGLGAVEMQRERERFGEARDEPFVLVSKRPSVRFLAQIRPAVHPTVTRDRHSQQAFHRRVVRREADGTRVTRHVLKPQCVILPDDDAEQPLAFGQAADARGLLGCDAGVHELLELAGVVEQADGGVARADEGGERFDGVLQQLGFAAVDGEQAQQAQRDRVQVHDRRRGGGQRRALEQRVEQARARHRAEERAVRFQHRHGLGFLPVQVRDGVGERSLRRDRRRRRSRQQVGEDAFVIGGGLAGRHQAEKPSAAGRVVIRGKNGIHRFSRLLRRRALIRADAHHRTQGVARRRHGYRLSASSATSTSRSRCRISSSPMSGLIWETTNAISLSFGMRRMIALRTMMSLMTSSSISR